MAEKSTHKKTGISDLSNTGPNKTRSGQKFDIHDYPITKERNNNKIR